ncbi:MAG: dihydrolipoyl dehydrogenase [Cytophagales bacterium]|nr:MAG: dihydrolipoyl dehydrogenase [Cytophagales bacterium]TAF61650.1 MAG: dihydrolipoyl dehydrogenase [Cytophagales bacterium]
MKYDVVVIGSGPGGYIAAVRCAQLDMKVAIIEKYSTLGGTCLNVGCIPSKALLDSSEHYHNAAKHFKIHGIEVNGLNIDFGKMIQRKREVVNTTCQGITFLMKKNKIDTYYGLGSFVSAQKIAVTAQDGSQKVLETSKTIIATGSKPTQLPFIPVDKKRIITSTEALELTEIPKHLIVIGGGIIGMEIGSVYGRLGSKVTVIEYLDGIIPSMDGSLGKELQRVLKKQLNFQFNLKHKVTGARVEGDMVHVEAENSQGEKVNFEGDYCLLAIGRSPYTAGLNLENAGLSADQRGKIVTNKHLQTGVDSIYAIGDVTYGAMLAHKAEEEGVFVAEHIAGQKPHINYNLIPSVVYTWPEAAGVGYTEEQLQKESIPYKRGEFPFRALGRARASTDIDGFVKILAHKDTDEILGAHIIGARAADLISEAVVAMEYRASAEDISRMSHAHPTYSEAFKEACLMATDNRPLNI